MGTLTAGQPRLPHYCEHKLPSSCRLSSIGECCACYDERPHAAFYQTYIDGVGFVPRGTRWQRYCWFCKEFWENRVEASGLRPAQTRIPERPDQTEFLKRWYEFHQGYRVVQREDGTDERIAVLGEDLKDVAPGCLPRTLEELRAGRERSEAEERERELNRQQQALASASVEESGPSLDDALNQMLEAATSEEARSSEHGHRPDPSVPPVNDPISLSLPSVHAQSIVPAGSRNREYQARRIAALRRELHRMRSGIERVISGLRELGENVPDHHEASQRLAALGSTLDTISPPSPEEARRAISSVNALTTTGGATRGDSTLANIQARVDEARRHFEEARRNRDQAQSELDVAEQEVRSTESRLRQLQNQQRTTENYMRLFGTREEMLAQGENYESPIGGMFNRAWERFRVAEEVRREERNLRQVLEDEERIASENVVERIAELQARDRDVWGVPVASDRSASAATRPTGPSPTLGSIIARLEEGQARLRSDLEQRGRDLTDGSPGSVATRTRIMAQLDPPDRATSTVVPPAGRIAGPLRGNESAHDAYRNSDRTLDAIFVLSALSETASLQEMLPDSMVPDDVNRLRQNAMNEDLSREDEQNMDIVMSNSELLWAVHLPAERNRRRRQRGERISFTPDAQNMAGAGQVIIHDVEVMAECYQMSGTIRDCSELSPPAKLSMRDRLQRGERNAEDRQILFTMLQNDWTFTRAREVNEESSGQDNQEGSSRRRTLENDRRQAARQGDHSRSELDAQRRATRGVALAASRMAMNAGPSALLQRMAERDEETRAAFQRLQDNGFAPPDTMTSRRLREPFYRHMNLNDFTASPSASDEAESDDEHRGLDARDSGRPEEPLTEEQMTVVLDCRVCYSQRAEICTLPCGHLTMCRWCSEQHSPTMEHDRTRPRRAAACPVCRKAIRQKVRVIRS